MRLEYAEEVELEVADARDVYEAERVGLGDAFLTELEATTARIVARPHQFPAVPGMGAMQRALMKRFPFRVFFEARGDVIRVFAVAHQSREPSYWHGRS